MSENSHVTPQIDINNNQTIPSESAKRLRRRIRRYVSWAVFRSVGHWLNKYRLPYIIEHRPDFHGTYGQMHDYDALRRGWVHGNQTNNGGDFARFYGLYLNIKQVLDEGVIGDFVELGVYKGNSAVMLAHFGRNACRHTYLFDTFSGFDSRDFKAEDESTRVLFTDTSLEAVQALVGKDGVTYVPGFFPESLAGTSLPDAIAVAHIDCDLYQPMKAAIAEFYPRLSPGGILIMHDYASGGWPGARRAVDEFFRDKPENVIVFPDKSGTALVRKI